LALGLTELAAGLSPAIPSALASVGAAVVAFAPEPVTSTAIRIFGTADKGALAVGTVVLVLLAGAATGVAAVRRRGVAPIVFGIFALVGIAAQLGAGAGAPLAAAMTTMLAAAAGVAVLWGLLEADRAAEARQGDAVKEAGRRRFLAVSATVAAGALVAVLVGRRSIIRRSEAAVVDAALPEPVVRAAEVGEDSDFGVPGLTPIVVGEPDFYRVDTTLAVPIVDPASWSLRVTGMVDREVELGYDDLLAMPQVERYVTISCVSNGVGGPLVGNARWQGVPLAEVLDMAGVRSGASQVVGRSVDGWTAGFPTEAVYDGRRPLIVVGMNGHPLPRRHGFPARLIVPGLYGYVSATKWLTEIELTTWDAFDGYWVPRGWAKKAPIKTQSRIDRPLAGERVTGPFVVAGVAWAPTRGIRKVEVQVDDGPWQEAEVTVPLSADAWVQWKVELVPAPGEHRLRVRATDGTGEMQTGEAHGPRPDGATGWHTIRFSAA